MTQSDYHIYEILGRRVRVRDTLGQFLLIYEELTDEYLTDVERAYVLVQMLFVDPSKVTEVYGDELQQAVSIALWECFGIDVDNSRRHEEQVLDLDEDRERIVVTVRGAYNLSWDELCGLPYKEAMILIGLAPRETPMGQAIYYRVGTPPKADKYNRKEREQWFKAKKYYALKKPKKAGMEKANDAATARFEAMRRAANG